MTVLCSGGASAPKTIAPAAAFLVGEAAVAIMVETLGLPIVWASLLAFAGGATFSMPTFCAADPPAMPTFNAGDVVSIISGNRFIGPEAYGKLDDLLAIAAWYLFCECSSVATPAPPAGPAYPPTAPQVNPPGLPVSTVEPCWDQLAQSSPIPFTPVAAGYFDMTPALVPIAGDHITVQPQTGFFIQAYRIPAGVTQIIIDMDITSGDDWAGLGYKEWSAAGANTGGGYIGLHNQHGSGGHYTWTLAAPAAGSTHWSFNSVNGFPNQTNTNTFDVRLRFYCTSPTQPAIPCCPPDPVLLGQLAQIRSLLESVYLGLPITTNSMAEGTVHSGLTGNGTIVLVDDAIAVRIVITTDNPTLRLSTGSPNYLFDRGFIVPIAAEGPIRVQSRLVYNPQLYILPPAADSVGYSLGQGITASIIEITRGP